MPMVSRKSALVVLTAIPVLSIIGGIVILSLPQTTSVRPEIAKTILSNYSVKLPDQSRLERAAEWTYRTPLEWSATKYTFCKVRLPANTFKRLLSEIKDSGAVFVASDLSRHPNADIPWWDNTSYDTCYYTELRNPASNAVLHIHLVTEATNSFVMLEHILVKPL